MQPGKYDHITDAELLQNFYQDHDNKWLGILLPRYTLLLLGVCMKYLKNEEDARDCVQQIFLKVINELRKYKVDYFKSWIYMIARNHCLVKLRDHKKTTLELNEHLASATNAESDKKKLLEKDALLQRMESALNKLNPDQKVCVKLFYLQKKSYSEVAEITGFTLMQVKSYLQNGKRNLKLLIENNP
ncbi:MAG: sigma-70 family RNA polymerase sigma factor [Bacteroidota bacterium]|nr:sigma-70 family RNA polymerase sigma factor [Bacteroidota bacterium]